MYLKDFQNIIGELLPSPRRIKAHIESEQYSRERIDGPPEQIDVEGDGIIVNEKTTVKFQPIGSQRDKTYKADLPERIFGLETAGFALSLVSHSLPYLVFDLFSLLTTCRIYYYSYQKKKK